MKTNFLLTLRGLLIVALLVINFQTSNAKDTTGTSLRVETLLSKAKGYLEISADSVVFYANQALKISEQFNYAPGMAEAYNVIGFTERQAGNSYQAIITFKKAMVIAESNKLDKVLSSILLNKGHAEEITGNYVSALDDYLKSIVLKQAINDSLGIAKCLNNIAQVYSRQGNVDKALEYFMKSLEIKKKFNDTLSIAKTYNNIGVLHTNQGQYQEGLEYFNRATELYKLTGSTDDIGSAMGNIAWTYDLMGSNDTALTYYLSSLQYILSNNDVYTEAVTRINIASLYIEKEDYASALNHLNKGLALAKSLDSKEDMKEAYKYLALLYSQNGDFKKAYEMQYEFQSVSDSILNEEKAATLAEMHIKYETSKKDEENRFLLKENELQKTILERNTYINWGLSILIFLVVIIAFLIVQQTRMRSRQVTMQLEQKILRSQMNPHFIFNSLQSIQGFIFEQNALEAGKYLADFSKLIRLILENSFYEKITTGKEIETLTYYLNLQKLRFSNKLSYNISFDPQLDSDNYEVPPMILQPFIENAIEHGIKPKAGTGHIAVNIKLAENSVIFTLEDDGIGRESAANITSINEHKSRAMAITTERMLLFNKKSKRKMRIAITDLVSPSGTRVVVEIPLKEIA